MTLSPPATLDALAAAIRTRFRQAGLETAALDARVLVAAACRVAPEQVVLSPHMPVEPEACARGLCFADQRLAGKSVGRILGCREFWGMEFLLSPHTLEPRPDTECLVQAVLDWCEIHGGHQRLWRFADVGTGTGAIAIALLGEMPQARALAVDLSADAVATARLNAVRNGAADRLLPVRGDFAAALAPDLDFIVSNPPYIAEHERATLADEVRMHDPDLALFGGADGLDAFRILFTQCRDRGTRRPTLMLEIGAEQAHAVTELAHAADFGHVAVKRDLAGRDRVVVASSVANPLQPPTP